MDSVALIMTDIESKLLGLKSNINAWMALITKAKTKQFKNRSFFG